MKVLFVAGREIGYARNEVLLRALRRFAQVDVVAAQKQPRSLFLNSMAVTLQSLPHLLKGGYDLIFVGFYGHFIQALISRLTQTPMLFDAFVSSYDTLCFDRQLFAPDSLPGRAAFWLDQSTTHAATHVLLDTPRHADYFVQTFALDAQKVSALPVGCQENIFTPRAHTAGQCTSHLTNGAAHGESAPPGEPNCVTPTRVLYYSTYLPLHGVETVIQAAARLQHEPIDFHLIGNGPQHAAAQQLAQKLQLHNITFIPPVSLPQIADAIADADICLGGHFGGSEKAGRVVPGKIYQMLAMARPVIASAAPANCDLLKHGQSAWLIPSGDPVALATAIHMLHGDCALRQRLGQQGRQLYEQACSEAIITDRLRQIVAATVGAASLPLRDGYTG